MPSTPWHFMTAPSMSTDSGSPTALPPPPVSEEEDEFFSDSFLNSAKNLSSTASGSEIFPYAPR